MSDMRIRMFAALALCATLSACTYWSDDFDRLVDQSGRDFSRDPGKVYTSVKFDDMVKNPHCYAFSDVQFLARLDRRCESVFIPMYGSHFKHEDYSGVSFWSIDAEIWDSTKTIKSVPTFFISKQNPDLQRLVNLDRYAEVSIRGRVRSDFGSLPWVEILYVDPVRMHSTTRAKYETEVREADDLLMTSAPVYQEVASQAAALPEDAAALRDLHEKAVMTRDNLAQAKFRYEMSLYHAPDPIATRDRIDQIGGLLNTLDEVIQAIADKRATMQVQPEPKQE